MKIWFQEWKDNHMLRDLVIEETADDTRTHRIFSALEKACYELDLGKPIWLDANITEFRKRAKTRFSSDHFVEEIEFDYLEMQILEE